MADTLRHRGPDSEGFYLDQYFALSIRRLRVIDLEAGIQKLAPGHLLVVSPDGKPRVTAYWDLSFSREESGDAVEWAQAIRTQLTQSVRHQLASDVPLGVFLSGGIDSSAIAALAAQLRGEDRLKTFSLGFAEESYDERPFAQTVAPHCGTEHTEIEFRRFSRKACAPP